uniref:Uncharacterized protein n=1 Tax=Chlamydomonas leiostraca TaxID=1034604 RepID=A0A7S0R7I3_9CHLO|mmetsp:Transcript_15427/g.38423  ORF Transcript_15427/g.38423 Transcript_15427/m.38423 type:complete len:227 (+) Transcript_15427:122-802(+)|eukprot:CAMPEP_0202862852 /NCGR_PEP_ID=MMETSP1391-20130828/3732_1 /ASSEMBLY_ACC=CAM_ASM_000867 /TAXON_ID=1034604 /ORGANISM="Chlamydomonas leiostraca, Strain SAG 11-49" /LENGTH=226 /DNA_ID=CAMNT_0049542433 /DNA_START=374 /DNA_END=1054 /DNA_ORIENTATION=+
MSKIVNIVIAIVTLCSWVVLLAGVAATTDVLMKSAKGKYDKADAGSVGSLGLTGDIDDYIKYDSSGDYYAATYGVPFNTGSRRLHAHETDEQELPGSHMMTRKLLSRGRHLLASVAEKYAGYQMSLYWWIVAFQLVISIFALVAAFAGKLRAQTNIYMAINSALLSYMAFEFVTTAWGLTEVKAKGSWTNGVKTTAAGVIASLVCNHLWLLINADHSEDGSIFADK